MAQSTSYAANDTMNFDVKFPNTNFLVGFYASLDATG